MSGFRILPPLAAALFLGACDEPMIPDSDVIRRAADPAYTYNELGRVAPTACRADRPSLYTSTSSACQRDLVFSRQVANPADLVNPARPGPPMAGPIGRAADQYIGGAVPPAGAQPGFPGGAPRGRLLYPAPDPLLPLPYPPPG